MFRIACRTLRRVFRFRIQTGVQHQGFWGQHPGSWGHDRSDGLPVRYLGSPIPPTNHFFHKVPDGCLYLRLV